MLPRRSRFDAAAAIPFPHRRRRRRPGRRRPRVRTRLPDVILDGLLDGLVVEVVRRPAARRLGGEPLAKLHLARAAPTAAAASAAPCTQGVAQGAPGTGATARGPRRCRAGRARTRSGLLRVPRRRRPRRRAEGAVLSSGRRRSPRASSPDKGFVFSNAPGWCPGLCPRLSQPF
ncbi:MAG: hypothetical protein J3K34DRAFT_423190 [Monoraphidium minutum]|nr:MAG: hypothetical protein J3K34DRAFT_423190 [Monoraphidium minutum]